MNEKLNHYIGEIVNFDNSKLKQDMTVAALNGTADEIKNILNDIVVLDEYLETYIYGKGLIENTIDIPSYTYLKSLLQERLEIVSSK